MEEYIGIIKLFAGNFAPRGFLPCDGRLLPISYPYDALFSLIGTTYGGDGRNTFALPDLRGRAPIGTGQGPGLGYYKQGEKGGQESITLSTENMPSHNHDILTAVEGNTDDPTNNYVAGAGLNSFSTIQNSNSRATELTGEEIPVPVSNMQPYLTIRYIICIEGLYPSRS
jgi:microcystin-dependent protein